MRIKILLVMLCFLPGCSLSAFVDADVMDYFEVGDLAANRIILLNILRAKDSAPLHFSQLSLVRGAISASASATASAPWGPQQHVTSVRRLATIATGASSSPSFDVGSLDTQDFTKGVMTPIAPATVKFFLDEGVDYRLVLLLLVSGVRTPGNQELVLNAPESSRLVCYSESIDQANALPKSYRIINRDEPCPSGRSEPEFFGFLRVLNHLRRVFAVNYVHAQMPVGGPFTLDMHTELRSLAMMDPAKHQLRKLASGQYQLVTTQRRESVVLCEAPDNGGSATVLSGLQGEEDGTGVPAGACVVHPQDEPVGDGKASSGTTDAFKLRSTLEVIRYIGRILAFQEASKNPDGSDRCVTLRFESQNPGCGGNILFHLSHNQGAGPIELEYGGQYWAVPAARTCDSSTSCDHTLETMAMVSLLLNQNKSVEDIRSTPAVEAVP